MATHVVQNPPAGAETEPEVALHEDGTRYPYRLVYDQGARIGYADSPEELLSLLVPGYLDLDEQERAIERIRLAVRVQVSAQATINSRLSPTEWAALSEAEQQVLNGPRFEQPTGWGEDEVFGDVWESEVPLVLVETGYEPFTAKPKPISGIADVRNPPNIIWLRPQEDWEFLTSLADPALGYVILQESTDI